MRSKSKTPAVVVLSGGQDSVTCLALAHRLHEVVHTISFDYGQKHHVELELASKASAYFGSASHNVVKVSALKDLFTSALIGTAGDYTVNDLHPEKAGLPASFVPQRNAIFLTLAHGLAQQLGAKEVYTGVCQTDYSGYPDCRSGFVMRLQLALNVGYEAKIHFNTPLMLATKAETWAIAAELGAMDYVRDWTNTCYNGDRDHYHEWGYGCGECPACVLRAKGYADFLTKRNMMSNADLHAYVEGYLTRDDQLDDEHNAVEVLDTAEANHHTVGLNLPPQEG